jgi:nicotinic acid phosphoribosyltransferase
MNFLDTDLYKITMGQAIAQKYPRADARYELIVRSPVRWPSSTRRATWRCSRRGGRSRGAA